MHDAELRGTLNERRLRLEDGRKGLVEIGRHLAEIAAPVRLRRQPQRDADLVDFGQGLGEFRASRRQLRLPLVVHLTRHIVPGDELLRPIEFNLRQRQCGLALVDSGDPRVQQRDLVIDVLHGVLQVPASAPGLRFDRARRRGGCLQVCFRGVDRCLLLGDRNPVRLLVQLGEEISLVHTVVVIHQNAGNLSCHAGRNKRHVPIHECVVRGDGVEHLLDPRDAEHEENCQDSNTEHTGQKLSLPRSLSGLLRHGAGLRRCLRGFRVVGSRSISIRCRLRIDRTWLVALLGHVGHPLQGDETDGVERPPLVLTGKILSSWPERYLGRLSVVSQFEICVRQGGLGSCPAPCHLLCMSAQRPRRPRDPNQLAKLIVDMATGEAPPDTVAEDGRNPAAVALGRLGGMKGGRARAESLSKRKRVEIARAAAKARWKGK